MKKCPERSSPIQEKRTFSSQNRHAALHKIDQRILYNCVGYYECVCYPSVLLNCNHPDVDLGQNLTRFKEFTSSMDPSVN